MRNALRLLLMEYVDKGTFRLKAMFHKLLQIGYSSILECTTTINNLKAYK